MTVGTSWSLIDHTEQIAQLAEAEADRAAELQRATDLHCQEELQLRRVARGRDTFKALAGQVAQQATAAPAPAAQQASNWPPCLVMEAFVASKHSCNRSLRPFLCCRLLTQSKG